MSPRTSLLCSPVRAERVVVHGIGRTTCPLHRFLSFTWKQSTWDDQGLSFCPVFKKVVSVHTTQNVLTCQAKQNKNPLKTRMCLLRTLLFWFDWEMPPTCSCIWGIHVWQAVVKGCGLGCLAGRVRVRVLSGSGPKSFVSWFPRLWASCGTSHCWRAKAKPSSRKGASWWAFGHSSDGGHSGGYRCHTQKMFQGERTHRLQEGYWVPLYSTTT